MESIKRLRELPLKKRKIILWTIVVILSIIFLFFSVNNFQNKLRKFEEDKKEFQEVINFSGMVLPEMPMPENPEERLIEIEQAIKQEIDNQED